MSDWLHEPRPYTPSPTIIKSIRFRDLNPDYMLNKDDIIVTETTAVQAQMRHLLSTLRGTEPFEPYFGSLLPLRLYQPITKVMGFMLETDTIIAISTWMASMVRVAANVKFEPLTDEDGYRIEIPYVLLESNTPNVYSFEALR